MFVPLSDADLSLRIHGLLKILALIDMLGMQEQQATGDPATLANEFMDRVLKQTSASHVFTYPGSPPRYLLRHVTQSDAELVQTVCEQHILPLAQTWYYRQLEAGTEEIPVVIVSGEMGEAMLFQPLIAGSITCPCLIIVGEGSFPHADNAVNMDHQTDRGFTEEKLGDKEHVLTEHENVDERMLFTGKDDLDALEALISRIKQRHSIGIVHVPLYTHQDGEHTALQDLLKQQPAKITSDILKQRWVETERPLLIVGRGCRHPAVRKRIETVAEQSGATVVSTLQMDGFFSTNYAGRLGPMGTPSANEAFYQSDFAVVLGASVKNTLTSFGTENIRLFREKAVQVEEGADRRSVLVGGWYHDSIGAALDILEQKAGNQWFDEPYGLEPKREQLPDNIRALGQVLREEFPEKVVNFGVGNALLWLPYALGPDMRKEVSRSGSMGEAVAGLNREDNPVIVLGDGEFEMDLSLITEAQYQESGATIIVVNNQRLGLVTERQDAEFGEIITPKKTDVIYYERIGAAFNDVESLCAETPDDVIAAVRNGLASDSVTIIEIRVDEYLSPDLFRPAVLPRLNQSS